MQKKSNIVSKLVLSTAAALMGVGAVNATEQPEIQESAQLANFLADVGGTFSVDKQGVEYKVDSKGEKKTASICDYDSSTISKNLTLEPKAVDDSDSTEYDVTKINAEAFKDCTKIETVEIPASVTDIGINAFDGCSNLKVLVFEGTNEQLANKNIDSAFLGTASLKSVYVDQKLNEAAKNALKKGVSNEILTRLNDSYTAGTLSGVTANPTEKGIELNWEKATLTGGDADSYLVLRKDNSDGHEEALALVLDTTSGDKSYTDTEAEFGKSYTYQVVPFINNSYFDEKTAAEFYEISQYDNYGMKKGETTDLNTLTMSQKLIDGIMHYYSDGELYTPVQNKNLTCVQGLDTQSWYVLDNSKTVYATKDNRLTVREWDLADGDKTAWDSMSLDAISKEDLAGKEYRVFSLNVQDTTGGVITDVTVGKTDDDLQPSNYAVYLELSKNMDPNSVRVVIPNDNGGLDYIYGDNAGEIEIVKSLPTSNAPKSDYGFAKIMLDSALPTQPFVMYADKIENSSSSSDSTENKEETKSEDKTEENKNNSSNGSTSGSKGYATGDVAGFGMLHAAYSMLAAAGSTLLGLFRKKK